MSRRLLQLHGSKKFPLFFYLSLNLIRIWFDASSPIPGRYCCNMLLTWSEAGSRVIIAASEQSDKLLNRVFTQDIVYCGTSTILQIRQFRRSTLKEGSKKAEVIVHRLNSGVNGKMEQFGEGALGRQGSLLLPALILTVIHRKSESKICRCRTGKQRAE